MPPRAFARHGRQRQEDVVANPERERHVPARPEDRRRGGRKRPIEILGHSDAQRARRANCDMRVSREIKKKLQPVAEGQTPDVGPAPARRSVECSDNAVAGQNTLVSSLATCIMKAPTAMRRNPSRISLDGVVRSLRNCGSISGMRHTGPAIVTGKNAMYSANSAKLGSSSSSR